MCGEFAGDKTDHLICKSDGKMVYSILGYTFFDTEKMLSLWFRNISG